jgi:hypothetical protein
MARKRRPRNVSTPRREPSSAPIAARRRDWWLIGSVAVLLLVLAAIADDRHVGLIADGRQMIRTAIAIVETGELGQALGRDFTYPRPTGDGVSRFGMATSLLQVPAALLAGPVEESLGAGASQGLFLIVPWLGVGLAALGAGMIARRLAGSDAQVAAAVMLASIASPVASYAFLEFSEPIQAAALTLGLAAAIEAACAQRPRRLLEVAAGFGAGLAVLTKSSLIVAAPWVLLPLLDWRDQRRTQRALAGAAAGASLPLAVWLVFEIVRFGQLFGGYPDDGFTHPWFDGAWRLLIGVNRGILLFWPALLLFGWAGWKYRGVMISSPAARGWTGAALVFIAQFAVAAGYWGWHGMEGWGPRLFLSAVPLMAPYAATAVTRSSPAVALTVLCVVINAPPLLQHPTPVATYVMNLGWPEIPESDAWRYPFYATSRSEAGNPTVVPFEVLEEMPAANPWRLYLWVHEASHRDAAELLDELRSPPWRPQRPDLVPPAAWRPEIARQAVPKPRVGFLGRSLTGTGGPYATVYLDALLDQTVRAHQQDRIERALRLSERRLRIRADGEAAAWRLETLRRAGRAADAESLLRSLPAETRSHPLINVVLALFDRELGQEQRARALLGSVAHAFAGTAVDQALTSPLSTWPGTLDAMTRAPRRDATVVGPR